MEFLNMVPVNQMVGQLMGITFAFVNYTLLAIGLYYLGKAIWVTFWRRY